MQAMSEREKNSSGTFGQTTQHKLKAWIEHLKQVNVQKKESKKEENLPPAQTVMDNNSPKQAQAQNLSRKEPAPIPLGRIQAPSPSRPSEEVVPKRIHTEKPLPPVPVHKENRRTREPASNRDFMTEKLEKAQVNQRIESYPKYAGEAPPPPVVSSPSEPTIEKKTPEELFPPSRGFPEPAGSPQQPSGGYPAQQQQPQQQHLPPYEEANPTRENAITSKITGKQGTSSKSFIERKHRGVPQQAGPNFSQSTNPRAASRKIPVLRPQKRKVGTKNAQPFLNKKPEHLGAAKEQINIEKNKEHHELLKAKYKRHLYDKMQKKYLTLEDQDKYHLHLKKVEDAEKKLRNMRETRRMELKQHLARILPQQKRLNAFNTMTNLERNIYKALVDWYDNHPEAKPPDGILEFKFKDIKLINTEFEPILGDIDSTLKIKNLRGSQKLKEMLLVVKRGKNIFMDFYKKDLKENIFTFMFLKGRLQSNQKCRETEKVINHFLEFGLDGIPDEA